MHDYATTMENRKEKERVKPQGTDADALVLKLHGRPQGEDPREASMYLRLRLDTPTPPTQPEE